MAKIVGIYKITSPSGKVYIGQSLDISKRWNEYKRPSFKKQPKLNNSIQKYGIGNHRFDVIHHLPNDIEKSVMDSYELLYALSYKDAGVELLNLRLGMNGGKMSEEAKDKLSKKLKGVKTGRKMAEGLKRKHSERMKVMNVGNKYAEGKKGRTGMKNSEETRRRISAALTKNKWQVWNEGVLINEFNTCKEAATFYGMPLPSFKSIYQRESKSDTNRMYFFEVKKIPC
jgi:group I intron endonuclease